MYEIETTEDMLVGHYLAYQFLSKVFYEAPAEDFINSLVSNQLFDDWPLDSEEAEIQTGLALLCDFSQSWNGEKFTALAKEYARLFIGPGHIPVPLWESVYRSPEHLLFDKETLQVRQDYQRFGMGVPRLNVEPDDQLGLELRFVAYLARLGLAAIEQAKPDKLNAILVGMRSFLDEHLLLWANDCLHDVIRYTDSPYYAGVAHLTLGCLAHTNVLLQLETAHESDQTRP